MLHEIIMSLLGFTGDIIIRVDDTFAVDPNFELLADTEKVRGYLFFFLWKQKLINFILGTSQSYRKNRMVL